MRARLVGLPAFWLALALGLAGASPGRTATFYDTLGSAPLFRPLAKSMRDTAARSIPLVAASPGVSFRYDPETGAFERSTTVLGQLFLQRAQTLGRHKWNASITYEWLQLDTLDGRNLDTLSDTSDLIVDPDGSGFITVPQFSLGLVVQQVTLGGTYGVTDDLDVSIALPLLASSFATDAVLRRPTGFTGTQTAHVRMSAFGVGDLLLHGKYHAVRSRWGDAALSLGLRIPTGNEENFQGIGVWEVSPGLYGTTPFVAVSDHVRLQAHANAVVDLNANDVSSSQGRFGIGLDCAVGRRATAAIAFLAREPFAAIAPPGFFDTRRVDPQTGRSFSGPLLGLDRSRPAYWDLSVGGRVVLWRETLIGYVNVLLPLNDDGFRSDVIPLAGIEAAF